MWCEVTSLVNLCASFPPLCSLALPLHLLPSPPLAPPPPPLLLHLLPLPLHPSPILFCRETISRLEYELKRAEQEAERLRALQETSHHVCCDWDPAPIKGVVVHANELIKGVAKSFILNRIYLSGAVLFEEHN